MSINLSLTTPAAPSGYVLAKPQADGQGNISIAVPLPAGLITLVDCNSATGLQGGLDCGAE